MSYPSKVTQEIVDLVKQLIAIDGKTIKETAVRVGVSQATVRNIKKAGFSLEKYQEVKAPNQVTPEVDIPVIGEPSNPEDVAVEEAPEKSTEEVAKDSTPSESVEGAAYGLIPEKTPVFMFRPETLLQHLWRSLKGLFGGN